MDIPEHDPDLPPSVADEPLELAAAPEPEPTVTCWRCERVGVPDAGRCRWCRARVAAIPPSPAHAPAAAGTESHPLKTVLVVYAVMLAVSVVWGWVLLAGGAKMTDDDLIFGTAALEILDTVLAVIALALVGGRSPAADHSTGVRVFAWLAAGPVLVLLVCLNFLYFAALREIIGRNDPPAWFSGLTAANIVLICVQPALVEELFFRFVAFGVLAHTTSTRAAVWVTAVMFAMAHIYNPLGLPYLFLVGVALGYARVYGGLALPVLMHFAHNFVVVAFEGVR